MKLKTVLEANVDRDQDYRNKTTVLLKKLIQYIKGKGLKAFEHTNISKVNALTIPLVKVDREYEQLLFGLSHFGSTKGVFVVKPGPKAGNNRDNYFQIRLTQVLSSEDIDAIKSGDVSDEKEMVDKIIKGIKKFNTTFSHEMIHYYDWLRRGESGKKFGKKKSASKKQTQTQHAQDYINDPVEMNAFTQQLFADIDKDKHLTKRMYSAFGGLDFKSFYKSEIAGRKNNVEFIDFLSPKNKKKFMVRVYQYWEKYFK